VAPIQLVPGFRSVSDRPGYQHDDVVNEGSNHQIRVEPLQFVQHWGNAKTEEKGTRRTPLPGPLLRAYRCEVGGAIGEIGRAIDPIQEIEEPSGLRESPGSFI